MAKRYFWRAWFSGWREVTAGQHRRLWVNFKNGAVALRGDTADRYIKEKHSRVFEDGSPELEIFLQEVN